MRKSFLVAGTAALALGVSGIAYAQAEPSITATASVSPTKSGTKSKPKPVSLKLSVTNSPESKTTAKQIQIKLPSTLKVSTKGLPQCTASDDALTQNPSVCSSSKAGKGSAKALLNPFATSPAPLTFVVTPYVGKNEILFLLSGAADAVLHGKVSGSKITIAITPELQQPAPGVYSALNGLETTISKKKGKNSLISSVGCKSKKHTIGVTVGYANNPNPPAKPSASTNVDAKCS
ncbi:hypothetical protein [Solirubrobacter soli]|uniref:hypothetical protein n=1 Tax=Solirubrobacter soli TaxID=363832 RepID=UPI00040FC7AC|nr:hypothetical protein [Solirubrobacter soli]